MPEITIQWCEWEDIVNKRFLELIENRDRYIIQYGSRGSSKSDFTSKKLIYRCLTEKYFRYILVRNNYNTIKDSSYQTIKDNIIDLGLGHLFKFRKQPLEIECINGNMFLARGCDDTANLKSLKDPTGIWWEEDIPEEADFITVTSSVRTKKADYLQEIFTINPEVEGNYEDNWFWKRFFEGHNERSFKDVTTIVVDEEEVELTYTIHHSWYKDNPHLPKQFIALLLDLKRTNPYYYTVFANGDWGNKKRGGLFYKRFDRAKTVDKKLRYNPNLALHLSVDFNVNPYMSATIWQIEGKVAKCIDELALESPDNTTRAICKEFERRYYNHAAGLFIYGDPSGKSEDTRSEKGHNDYRIILNELTRYKPRQRVAKKHPPVATRGNFMNVLFDTGFKGVSLLIADKCTHIKNDLLFGREASDGTKLKEKTTVDGLSFEKYHHHSDTMDYFFCEAFRTEFNQYQHGSDPTVRTFGSNNYNRSKRF